MSKRANGEGSLFQRKDGRWAGSAFVLTPQGTRRRVDVYGRTRGEAHEKLTALVRKTHQGVPGSEDSRTVGAWLWHWHEHIASPRLRPTTIQSYESNLRVHLVPGLGRYRLDRLTPAQVRSFLDGKIKGGLSTRTVQYLHAILRAALAQAMRDELITRNVAALVTAPRVSRDEIEPFTPEQARTLLAACQSDRLGALYTVALACGLRRGEALALSWDDIDLEAGTLHVRRTVSRIKGEFVWGEPKSKRSRRSIPLPGVCVDALRAHRVRQSAERLAVGPAWQDSGLVFTTAVGTPFEGSSLLRAFHALLESAGLPKRRLHDLRHTCATLLLVQGVPARVVMETLGHSQIALTLNTYSHVLPVMQRDAADLMDAALRG